MYRSSLIAICALLLGAAPAMAAVLYDSAPGTLPESQGWLFYGASGTVTTHSATVGKATLDTGDNATQAGWTNTYPIINTLVNGGFPSLDRTNGFSLSFGLKLLSESHVSNDRAGVSVILLANDHQGIELGFWNNEIWAQSGPTFTHGEGVAATTTDFHNYTLTIQGTGYTLNDGTTDILSGNLRDYSSGLAVPYGLNNYLFVGDDTTSATGSFELSSLVIQVPEPSFLSALVLAIGLVGCTRCRRQ